MPKKALVEGEVVVRNGNTVDIEFYTEEFILDDSIKTMPDARRLLKKALVSDRLMRTVKNFKRVRTVQVIEFKDTDEKAENSDLDKLMIEAVELNCVPENISSYRRPDYKIKALQRAIEAKKEKLAKPEKQDETDLGYVD